MQEWKENTNLNVVFTAQGKNMEIDEGYDYSGYGYY